MQACAANNLRTAHRSSELRISSTLTSMSLKGLPTLAENGPPDWETIEDIYERPRSMLLL